MTRLARFVLQSAVNKPFFLAVVFVLSLAAAPLYADVEVTLKSGASLVGKVTISGNEAIVKIDDAELKVPLAEIDSIAAVDAGPDRQAQRLLMTALEARLNKDGGTEVIGLLSEAARLAPEDPHIAYWYASSLSDAGFGQAANDVLIKQRDAIAKAYPGLIDQLADRVKKRVEMEKMPPALVERLDALNAAAAAQNANAEMRQMLVYFRLVDQDDMPLERSDFQIQCNGQDEILEPFDDGYFVYTFNMHRNNDDQPCHLDITRPGLESKSFEFSGASNRVHNAGKLAVRRYGEDAKKKFRALVIDAAGQPVVGAQVTLQAMSSRGNTSNNTLAGDTDGEGKAEILGFPMKYMYRVQAEGFNPTSGNTELRPDGSEPAEMKLQLYRAVEATIHLAWESTSTQGGGKTSGEATLNIGSGAQPQGYGQNETGWIRPSQQKDRLTLQFMDNPFGYGGPFGGGADAWVRVVASESDAKEEAKEAEAKEGEEKEAEKKPLGLDDFDKLDLDDVDAFKKKLRQPKMLAGGQVTGPRPPMLLPAEVGKIYVGRLQYRDMRTGQPTQMAFKVFVEEMSAGDEDGE